MKMQRTKLPPRQHWHEDSVYIDVKPNFKDALKMVFEELNAIYRFEGNKLVMYESEFEYFLGFMKPVIEFCDTLRKKGEINE